MYSIEDYNYTLPEHLIAQRPAPSRDQSRLMVLDRKQKRVSHQTFADVAEHLRPGDLVVVNNTRVVPARLFGSKETGGKAEVLILSYPADAPESLFSGQVTCECLVKTSKPPKIGSKIFFDGDSEADVLDGEHGRFNLRFRFKGDFESLLDKIGQIPLPPYIMRDETKEAPCDDRVCYQTVYAEKRGAVAAPTAGLHFSQDLLEGLVNKGVAVVPITLHVGYGTFLPVRVLDIREHRVHREAYELSKDAAAVINRAKDERRRIIGVGTTTVRVLEYAANGSGRVRPGSGQCDLFILPGFEYRIVDALLTNFHLPKTSLLMLVAAFAGRRFMLSAYEEAIRLEYRFYSYGDAMLIT